MQTEFIRTALKIAETGHYSTAARAMFIAQTTAFHQIQSVENELGFKLFVCRTKSLKGGVVLTEKGATFLYFASQALAMLEAGRLGAVEKAS